MRKITSFIKTFFKRNGLLDYHLLIHHIFYRPNRAYVSIQRKEQTKNDKSRSLF